jgi:iron(III) transport system substrate-binding protein
MRSRRAVTEASCGALGDGAADARGSLAMRVRRFTRFVLAIAAIPLVAATAQGSSGATSPGGDWQAEWDALVEAAQAEGELVVLSHASGPAEQPVYDQFGEQFGIEMEYVYGSTDEVVTRLLAEREQGLYTADVSMPGPSAHSRLIEAGVYQPLLPQILIPDVLDRSTGWYLDHWPWHPADTTQETVTLTHLLAGPNWPTRFFYNTENITEDDLANINTWEDLLNPEWRWLIGDVPSGEGAADRALGWYILGESYWDTFMHDLDVQVMTMTEPRVFADLLVRGDVDFAIFTGDAGVSLLEAQDLGLPVAVFPKTLDPGPIGSPFGNMALMDQPAHPNAARLFVNWLLSVDGQTAFNEHIERPDRLALRSDVPQGIISEDIWSVAIDPNFEVIDVGTPEFTAATDESLVWWTDVFQELGLAP